MMAADWSTLPADCLLATNDVDYYMDLRAVCHNWREATTDPKSSPCDPRFRPSRWVFLPQDKHFNDDEIGLFVNTSTGRFVRKSLPLLRSYRLVTTITGGFLALADREAPYTASVLNPLTGFLIRFKAAVPSSDMHMTVDVVRELATLVLARSGWYESGRFSFYLAEPDSEHFRLKETYVGAVELDLLEHQDEKAFELLDPLRFSLLQPRFLVAELAPGEMVLVRRRPMEQIYSIGSRAFFLGYRCLCLSIDADKFPSIDANCIYYKRTVDDASGTYVYDLAHGTQKRIAVDVSHPSTLIQLLYNYTMHAPWYQPGFDEFFGKIAVI